MSSFTRINLSRLPPPDLVETLDFEAIVTAMRDDVVARFPAIEDTIDLESEPTRKLIEAFAYREMLLRARVNDAVRGVMLSSAVGADLDQIAANFSVERKMIDAGDPGASPPIPPTYEADDDLRARVQLSFEGLSTAGPEGAYVFHALGADGDVLDVSVASPSPGDVVVTVLSRQGDGTASAGLLAAVDAVLSDDDVRPLTDNVTVQSATIITYAVEAELTLYPGPDETAVLDAANAALDAYVTAQQRLGRDVSRSGLFAALHQPGVQDVNLISPAAHIEVAANEAARCTGTTVTVVGIDV